MVDSEARAHRIAAQKAAGGRLLGRGPDVCSHRRSERAADRRVGKDAARRISVKAAGFDSE